MCSAATLVLRAQVLQTLSDFPGSFSNFRFTSIADTHHTDSISNAFSSSRIKEERGFQSNILVLPRWQNITYKCGSDHPPRFASFWERDLPNLQQFCKTKWKQLEPFPGISLRFWSFPCSTWVWQLSSSVILTSVWTPSHIRFLQIMRIVCIITCKNFSRESGSRGWRSLHLFLSPVPPLLTTPLLFFPLLDIQRFIRAWKRSVWGRSFFITTPCLLLPVTFGKSSPI